MALKRFLMIGFVAALVACGDDDSSDFATRPGGDSSSACEDCDDLGSSSGSKKGDAGTESGMTSSSVKFSSSDGSSSSSVTSSPSNSVREGYVDPSTVVKGTMTDERDGQTYKTVAIGTQTWMAENLNYETDNSYCYDNSADNCTKYGHLYTWAAAVGKSEDECGDGHSCSFNIQGVCPDGWHLPSSNEWNSLFDAVGGSSTAGIMLKSTSGWKSGGNGTDAYGFSALPTGYRDYDGNFYGFLGADTYFWSSTEYRSYGAFSMYLYYDSENARMGYDRKYFGLSVRCLKDDN